MGSALDLILSYCYNKYVMQTQITQNKNSHVALNVEISGKEVARYFENAYNDLSPSVIVSGFRPGKAPRAMIIESIGRQRLGNLAIESAIKKSLIEGFKNNKLDPIGSPSISVVKYPDFSGDVPTDLEFNAEFDVLPKVKFTKKYTGIKLTPAPKGFDDVTDDDVEKILGELANRRAQFKPLKRAAQKGDRIEISFTGYDGKIAIEPLTSKHHPVILGTNTLIPGFEDHLIGTKKGDKKTFEITFPKDYYAKQFAGKKYKFDVETERVDEVNLPKIDDELAKSFGAKQLDDLRKLLRKNLIAEKEAQIKNKKEDEIVQYLFKIARADLPATLVEGEKQRLLQNINSLLEQKKSNMDEYLQIIKTTKEKLDEDLIRQSGKNVLIGLALRQIAKNEKIELKKDESLVKVLEWMINHSV